MLGFVLVDWLRVVSGPVGSVATTVFEGYVGAGGGLDTLLGTRVFEPPSTIRIVATGVLIGVVGPLVGAFLVHRQMTFIGETLAHTAFAGVAVGAMQILGVILVTGLLVIPAAAASQLARSFRETLVLSVLFGQLSVLAGLFVALVGSLPAGGLIIVAAIVVYLLALFASDRAAGAISVH